MNSLSSKMLSVKSLLSVLAFTTFFVSTNLMANSCSKSDVDYYLQKGFTNDQVVMLCSATTTAAKPAPVARRNIPEQNPNYPTSAPASNYSNNRLGEDQVFLSTALNATNVKLTPQAFTYDTKECVEYGYKNNPDLANEACVQSRISINTAGLKILKVSRGLFLIKDANLLVQGNIQREYLNFNSVRRQERSAIKSLLPTRPSRINIPVKRGIDPRQVADKLRSYSR